MADSDNRRKENPAPRSTDELRRRAEEFIDGLASSRADATSTEDAVATLHELLVLQTELEMQNEELVRAQLDPSEQQSKYFDLFDLAPVGYLTLSEKGMICEANLTAARLLGEDRRSLAGRPFSAFVVAADCDAYYLHTNALKKTGAALTLELRLSRTDSELGDESGYFWALLKDLPQPVANDEARVFWVTFTDISEQVQAKEMLRESAERYQTILRTAMDGFLLLDADTRVLEVNDAYCKKSGYTEAELLTMRISDLAVPETPDEVAAHAARITETGLDRFETVHRRKDGSLFEAEASVSVQAEDGRFSVFLRDTTERKRAEAALLESEQLLLESQRVARVGHYVLDFRTGMWTSSAVLDDIYGIDKSFVRSVENWLQIIHPDEREVMLDSFQAEASGEQREFDTDHRIIRVTDGAELVLHGRGRVEVDDKGEPVRMFGVIQDVTERKRSEEALRKSAERYQTILQTAMDGFSLIDMEGRVLKVNEAYAKMCGYSVEELLGMRIQNLIPSDSADDIALHMKTLLADGQDRFESRHLRKDGSVFDMELSVQYRPADGGQMAAFIRDVSQRKQADRLLALQSELLNNLASQSTTQGAVEGIVEAIQRATGLDAVGLRLPQDDDYPFFSSVGYDEEFLKTENVLAVTYPDGGLCRSEDGSVMLECTCGVVLRGDFEPNDPLFTAGGSVWTNDSAPFLELPPEQDPRLNPRNKCVHVGFQSLALIPLRAGDEIFGLLHLADRRKDRFTPDSIHFFEGVCSSLGTALRRMHAEEEIIQQKERLDRMLTSVIEIAGSIAEARDPYTAGHQRRVSEIAASISREMGVTAEQIEEIRVAALIHDVGKMSVPAEILSKPGKLSAIEFEIIKSHAEAGYRIIASANLEGPVAEIVYQHHERCDGSGYPRGLAADELLPASKVLMVADVVEAMMSHRPYRASLGIDAALAEIERGAGTLYDTEVAESCLRIFRENKFALAEV